jgi:hypothetical protein
MAVTRLRRNKVDLNAFLKRSTQEQKRLIKVAGRDFELCLSDCANNILAGTLPITSPQRRILQGCKQLVREVSKPPASKIRRMLAAKGTKALYRALILPALSVV